MAGGGSAVQLAAPGTGMSGLLSLFLQKMEKYIMIGVS